MSGAGPVHGPQLSTGAAARVRDSKSAAAGMAAVLFATAVAVLPLLVRGASCGHDFDFHLLSWLDCLNAWRHGIFYPHWAASANYGAGEPRFVFYPPLTWMLGAALGAVMPWTAVPLAITFVLLAGTGLATRALAREALDEGAATLAGCVAVFSGYALFTAYERTAFAELAGGPWIPLVLRYGLRPDTGGSFWSRTPDTNTVALALTIAGAWLVNPTVGVMACYLLAAVALAQSMLTHSALGAVRATVGALLGMGLVGIYLLPAAWEQRWVDIHQVTQDIGQMVENNWIFGVHADPSLVLHDRVLLTASIITVTMISVAFSGLLLCGLRRRLPGKRQWWVPLALVPVAVLLLQFPVSRPIWNLLPELRFLQFPWRWLLVLEAPMAVFAAAAIWPRASAGRWVRILVGVACAGVFGALTIYAGRVYYQPCDAEDAIPGMLKVYHAGQGFMGTYEYEPLGADNGLVATGLPQACLVTDPRARLGAQNSDGNLIWKPEQGGCEPMYPAAADENPEHLRLEGVVGHAGFLILRLRSFPAWRVTVNGSPVNHPVKRADGLVVVPVVGGKVMVAADWTATTDVQVGRGISAVALILIVGMCLQAQRSTRRRLS